MIFRFHFLNVGNGDCSIIEHPSGRISIIDINKGQKQTNESEKFNESASGNYNQKENPEHPIEYLKHLVGNKSIFRFILTHPDMDHMRGIKNLFDNFEVLNFWDTNNEKKIENFSTKQDEEDWEYYQSIRKGSKENLTILYLYRFQTSECCWTQDGITILSPTEKLVEEANRNKDWNLLSYVLLIEYKNFKLVLSGDATDDTWDDILEDLKNRNKLNLIQNIDVLVSPHHGRKSNRDYEFLKIMKPKLTLIGNAQSKHLNYNAYKRYSKRTLTNNQAGNIVIQKDNIDEKWYVLITNEFFAKNEKEKDLDKNDNIIAGRKYYYLWRIK
jgi:competence protein ComEC